MWYIKPMLDKLERAVELLERFEALMVQLPTKGDVMPALDDLKAAVAALNTSISSEIAAVTAKLGSFSGAVPAADAEALVTQLTALQGTLDAETATLTSAPAPPLNPTS